MFDALDAFVDIDQIKNDRVLRARVRGQALSVILLLTLSPPYAFFFQSLGVSWSAPILLPISLLSPVWFFIFTRRGRINAGGWAISISAFLFILGALIARGGMNSNAAAWMLVVPAHATLAAGPRQGAYMALATALAFVGLWIIEQLGVPLPAGLPAELLHWMPLIDYPAIVLTLGAMLFIQTSIWEAAERDARDAAQARYTFLTTISHEIRTPLYGVLGLTELLLESDLDPDQRELATTVQRSSKLLRSLLDDVLDYSKIDLGRLDLERVPVDLEELCTETIQLWENSARERGLRLDAHLDASAPRRIFGDPTKLRQIINNLVSNAIKFTERGFVQLTIKAAGERLSIAVEDSGIGITSEAAARIFDVFQQADDTTTRRFGGTGLGLAICDRLAQLMEGTIRLSSSPGVGSTFTFELPFERAAPPDEPTAAPRPTRLLEGVEILVAEDNPVGQLVTRRLLERYGAQVRIASNGEECMALWREHPPELILMDCQMPTMDGYEATRGIRAEGGTLPIIALTASSTVDERTLSFQSGMNDHLGKPIDAESLAATIARHCRQRPTHAQSGAAATPPEAPPQQL